jgi:hypothetical protein
VIIQILLAGAQQLAGTLQMHNAHNNQLSAVAGKQQKREVLTTLRSCFCCCLALQYDFFPCQHQLYSYGKGKGQMWYEPVFKALTLDGQEVWRRRRYRVRRGTTPGTFYYSVLDNGVTSNEVSCK